MTEKGKGLAQDREGGQETETENPMYRDKTHQAQQSTTVAMSHIHSLLFYGQSL